MLKEEILHILRCPACAGQFSLISPEKITCRSCQAIYNQEAGIWLLAKKQADDVWDISYTQAGQDALNYFAAKLQKVNPDSIVFKSYYVFVELLYQHLKGKKVKNYLDIGCGSGSYSLALTKKILPANIILLDYSLPALRLARDLFAKFNIECSLIYADAFNLPLIDNCIVLSITSGLFEHFQEDKQKLLIKEECRVSQYVSCHLPGNFWPYWLYRFVVTMINRGWPFGYEQPLKPKQTLSFFQDNG